MTPMLLGRDELIAALFRETDRAQRMKTPLAVVLCAVEGWEGWRSRLPETVLEEAVRELSRRILRLLRCYDSAERWGDGEFLLVLPGCNSFNAVLLAERLSIEVFGTPVVVGGEEMRFAGCFGVAGGGGRTPFVVLRDAESALKTARERGPGAIQRCHTHADPDPATLLIPVLDDEALHW